MALCGAAAALAALFVLGVAGEFPKRSNNQQAHEQSKPVVNSQAISVENNVFHDDC